MNNSPFASAPREAETIPTALSSARTAKLFEPVQVGGLS